LTGQNVGITARNYADESFVLDVGAALGQNYSPGSWLTASNASTSTTAGGSTFVLGMPAGFEPGTPYWSPGSLLAEWNAVPDVPVFNLGIAAIDNYSPHISPGGVLVGYGEDFQFTSPGAVLAGGTKSTPVPTLNEFGLVLRGVNPEMFGGAPSSVKSAPLQVAAVPTGTSFSSSAPTVLASPSSAPPATSSRVAEPTVTTQSPTGNTGQAATALPAITQPAITLPAITTAPTVQTIATVAEAFMTTSVPSTTTSGSLTSGFAGGEIRPNLIGNSILPLDTPEPATFAALGLGIAFLGWKRRRMK
jgi:hypothetical protein